MAIKEIFAGVDIEGRPGFGVQRAESDKLGAVACGPSGPVLLPQVIEQRKSLFELFEILAHGAVLSPETSVGEGGQHSQARMVGETENFSETQRPENLQNLSQPG